MDIKNLLEKGLFHLFGELFTAEVNSVRLEPPNIAECVLSMGKKSGQTLCPEYECFQFPKCGISIPIYY